MSQERHHYSQERHGSQMSGRLSGRLSRSGTRDEHSPLRSKRRSTGRKKSTNRSTGRLHVSDRLMGSHQQVHGNRHVGGCCHGSGLREKEGIPAQRSKSPEQKKKKKKTKIVLSPSRKFAMHNEEREEEFKNYKNLVE